MPQTYVPSRFGLTEPLEVVRTCSGRVIGFRPIRCGGWCRVVSGSDFSYIEASRWATKQNFVTPALNLPEHHRKEREREM